MFIQKKEYLNNPEKRKEKSWRKWIWIPKCRIKFHDILFSIQKFQVHIGTLNKHRQTISNFRNEDWTFILKGKTFLQNFIIFKKKWMICIWRENEEEVPFLLKKKVFHGLMNHRFFDISFKEQQPLPHHLEFFYRKKSNFRN